MITNVIFDLGNVLLRYNPLEYVGAKVQHEQTARQVHEAIFRSEEWVMLDRGVISEAAAIERIVARHAEHEGLIRSCMANWYEMLTPIEGNVEVLKKLKAKGYKTFILSNYHQKAFEQVSQAYDLFEWVDGGIISYREQLLKPEPQIYQTLIARYRLNPAESVFIDDMHENIAGAEQAGLSTILLEDPANLRELLAAKGIRI